MPQKYLSFCFVDPQTHFLVASSLPKGTCPKGVALENCPLHITLKQDHAFRVGPGLDNYGGPCIMVQVLQDKELTTETPHPILWKTYKNVYEDICANCQKENGGH